MNMKNLIKSALLLLALLLPVTATAYDFEVDGIYYDINGNEASVTYKTSNFNSYSGDVTIPSTVTYNGVTYSVVSIGQRAFQKCVDLTSVTIPNSVTVIGYWAFYYCSSLTTMTIPNSVTAIGDEAFYNCRSLTSVTIPNSVISIGENAFAGCENLTSLTIPSSVTYIGGAVFLWCSGLESITVDSENPVYDSRNNCNAIIETSSNTLIVGCKNTMIPKSVTSIGQFAFWGCTGLTSVTIPDKATSIGNGAFGGCTGLTGMTIPNGITSIGYRAFEGCSGLTSVIIPNSVTAMGNNAFYDCQSLTDVFSYITNPSAITMGLYVFYQESADYSGRTLHVPQRKAGAYRTDSNWYPYFGAIVEMESTGWLPGDVNGNGEVNIADVNALIDIILDKNGYSTAADVNNDGEITIADVNAVIDIIMSGGVPITDDHEWVDLGLPSGTLWATRDIGANCPEEGGDLFAWGETEPKDNYTWETYKWCNGSGESLTKYCTDSRYGPVDNLTELELEDDAAYVNWGPSWRMPTLDQIQELISSCTFTRVEKNGVTLRLVTGPNGNTLFLPADGDYWSRKTYGSPDLACGMLLQSGNWSCYTSWGPRFSGHRVRAVRVRN